MTYEELKEIISMYGKKKGCVWFVNTENYPYKKRVLVKYDSYRRYYMSTINGDTLCRVSEDTFRSNVEYLIKHNFHISY